MQESIHTVKPLIFLSSESVKEHGDEIVIPRFLFESWLEHFPKGIPMLTNMTSIDTGISRIVCIGSSEVGNHVYAPSWILEQLGATDDAMVSLQPCITEMPFATKICLRPLDNAAYHTDLRNVFEQYLDMFHVLEEGTTLSVPLEELGGFEINAFIERMEPTPRCRLGGEVIIEFLEPLGGIPEHEQPVEQESVEQAPVEQAPVLQTQAVGGSGGSGSMTKEEFAASWSKRFKELQPNA
jgi:hypothetical protein